MSARDAIRIKKLIHMARTIMGQNLETSESVRSRRSLNLLLSIMEKPPHPLHDTLQRQQSSCSNRPIQLHSHQEHIRESLLMMMMMMIMRAFLFKDCFK